MKKKRPPLFLSRSLSLNFFFSLSLSFFRFIFILPSPFSLSFSFHFLQLFVYLSLYYSVFHSLALSVSLSLTHTHTRTHIHTLQEGTTIFLLILCFLLSIYVTLMHANIQFLFLLIKMSCIYSANFIQITLFSKYIFLFREIAKSAYHLLDIHIQFWYNLTQVK